MNKILHIINGEFYSGAERVQDLLAINLPDYGYHCDFVCLKPGKFLESRRAKDSQVFPLLMTSRFDFSIISRLVSLIKSGNYKIVHTHTARSALIGRIACFLAGVPMVHHLHSPTKADTENKVRNFVNVVIEKVSLAKIARIIPVSESLGRYARACGFPADKITVVPNGVPVASEQQAWKKLDGPWILGVVALFRPRKGIEVLLKAVKLLTDKGFNVRVRAVGGFETSTYENEIHALCTELGIVDRIDWVGFTNDVSAEFAKMDLFILPSLFGEGLPMVVIESMSAGIPVISTAVEGIPEVIGVDNSGFIAQAGNVDSLAESIEQVLLSSHEQIQSVVQNAYSRQRDYFSDRSMAKRVSEVYSSVLSG